MNEVIILTDSPEAAEEKTVTGWVSRHGLFYGKNERAARWDGATHVRCATEGCDEISPKSYIYCENCRAVRTRERYFRLPLVEYDGKSMLVEFGSDTYYQDEDDVIENCENDEREVSDLMLVVCKPQYAPEFDIFDYLHDYLPEDADEYYLTDEIKKAVDILNTAFKKAGALSWVEGDKRVTLNSKDFK